MLNTFEFHCSSLCNVVFQVVTAERFYFKRPQASNYDAFPCSILSKGAAALIKQNSIQERSVLKLLACRLADRPAKGWLHDFLQLSIMMLLLRLPSDLIITVRSQRNLFVWVHTDVVRGYFYWRCMKYSLCVGSEHSIRPVNEPFSFPSTFPKGE